MSMDDLYNNLKVYEAEIKDQSSSSSNSQNVAFVFSKNTSNTNEAVNTAHEVSTASSQGQASSSTYVDDVMFSFFVNQSNSTLLDNEDLEQIDTDNLEEMDLKWQVAMLIIRVKRFLKKTGRNLNFNGKETVCFDKIKVECYNYHRRGHFARECRAPRNQGNRNGDALRRIVSVETPANALVVQDGIGGYDWSFQAEEDITNFSLMAYTSQGSSSSDSELNKSDVGFDSQMNENELHDCNLNKSEVFKSASDSSVNEIEEEYNQINDRFKKVEGYHAVPPPYTGNFKPARPDLSFAGLDDSVYKTNVSETIFSVPRIESTASKSSKDSLEQPKDGRVTVKWKLEPVWNNAQRVNHQNFLNNLTYPHLRRNFVPTAVATKSGQVPVNAAKQSSLRAATSINTTRPVNTAPLNQKVNNVTTAGPKAVVSTTEGKRGNAVKSSMLNLETNSKSIKDFFDSRCSRHMTRNKSYLIDYQDIDGGFVAFAGSPKGGIKREFSVARTPQQNGVAERKNRTLIEAARTISPSIRFMRPFRCLVTILNTLDPLGKFNGKANEGFLVGYSINSKDFRVFNTRTRKVEENMHIKFLENKPNVTGSGLEWLFNIDSLTKSINYEPVTERNQTNKNAGIKDNVDAVPTQQYILLPLLYDSPQSSKDAVAVDANEEPTHEGERNGQEKEGGASNKENDQKVQDLKAKLDNLLVQQKEGYANSTNRDCTVSPSISTDGQNFTNTDDLPTDPLIPDLEDTSIFSGVYDDEDVGAEADLNNMEITMNVSHIPTTRIHKDHPKD
ncbi:ribonuclease H-like domain-containing protein [Tanacetum coccineum]